MKQRRSCSKLNFHVVTEVKYRQRTFCSISDEECIHQFIKYKAHLLDAYLIEFGSWYDHIHLLLQLKPSVAPAMVYGQLKGYSAAMWNKKFPQRPLKWGDGVYIETVSPENSNALKAYIRNQRLHHAQSTCCSMWEPNI